MTLLQSLVWPCRLPNVLRQLSPWGCLGDVHQGMCMALTLNVPGAPRRVSPTMRNGCGTIGATAMRTLRSAGSRSRLLPLTMQELLRRRRTPVFLEG